MRIVTPLSRACAAPGPRVVGIFSGCAAHTSVAAPAHDPSLSRRHPKTNLYYSRRRVSPLCMIYSHACTPHTPPCACPSAASNMCVATRRRCFSYRNQWWRRTKRRITQVVGARSHKSIVCQSRRGPTCSPIATSPQSTFAPGPVCSPCGRIQTGGCYIAQIIGMGFFLTPV